LYPRLQKLAGSPDGALFAVGASVLLLDGAQLRDTGLPPTFFVEAFWAASRSSAFASCSSAAGHQILHWDGTSWTVDFTGGGLYGIWGSSASDIWAVGEGLRILHRGASGWSEVHPASLGGEWDSWGFGSLFGSGADDLWVIGVRSWWTRASGCVGQEGAVQHWDGTRWSPVGIDWNKGNCMYNSDMLWTGASAGRGKAWLAGDRGAIAFASASGATRISTAAGFRGIWGPSPDRIYATQGCPRC